MIPISDGLTKTPFGDATFFVNNSCHHHLQLFSLIKRFEVCDTSFPKTNRTTAMNTNVRVFYQQVVWDEFNVLRKPIHHFPRTGILVASTSTLSVVLPVMPLAIKMTTAYYRNSLLSLLVPGCHCLSNGGLRRYAYTCIYVYTMVQIGAKVQTYIRYVPFVRRRNRSSLTDRYRCEFTIFEQIHTNYIVSLWQKVIYVYRSDTCMMSFVFLETYHWSRCIS